MTQVNGWVIFLLVIALVIILLLCPVVIKVDFKESFKVQLRYLFIFYTVYPQKEKKQNKKEKNTETKPQKTETKKEEQQTVSDIRRIIKKEGISGFFEVLGDIGRIVLKLPVYIQKKLKISKLYLDISVSSDNAADTAVNYGKVCAVAYPALSVITGIFKYRSLSVSIYPDFDKKETEIFLHTVLKMSLLSIIIFAIKALLTFVKSMKILKDRANTNLNKHHKL